MQKRVLVLTHSAGFKHDYLPSAETAVVELGRQSEQFQADVRRDCSEVAWQRIGKDYRAVLFATTGELPVTQEDRSTFADALRSGLGFIGVHNATDTFYQFEDYGKLIGGYFSGHPWNQDIVARVEDNSHPSTRHLGPTFKVREEVYTFRNWSRDRTHVLISLVNDSVDLSKGNRPDNDYALSWCHNFGRGRVFYTAFGHFPELWGEKWFRAHLLGGITWAMQPTTQ